MARPVTMSAKKSKKTGSKERLKTHLKAKKTAKPAKKLAAKKVASGQAPARSKAVAAKVTQAKLKLTKQSSAKDLAAAAKKLKAGDVAPAPAAAAPVVTAKPVLKMKLNPKVCREEGCEADPAMGEYCRIHYIRNWRKIKRKEVILKERKLNQYVEELINKYPEKYIEAIQQDLANDRDFSKVVHDLELSLSIEDEEGESETIDTLLGNIRKDIDVDGAPSVGSVEDDEDLF